MISKIWLMITISDCLNTWQILQTINEIKRWYNSFRELLLGFCNKSLTFTMSVSRFVMSLTRLKSRGSLPIREALKISWQNLKKSLDQVFWNIWTIRSGHQRGLHCQRRSKYSIWLYMLVMRNIWSIFSPSFTIWKVKMKRISYFKWIFQRILKLNKETYP